MDLRSFHLPPQTEILNHLEAVGEHIGRFAFWIYGLLPHESVFPGDWVGAAGIFSFLSGSTLLCLWLVVRRYTETAD